MSEEEVLELDEAVAELERQAERDTRRGRVILVVVSVVVVFLMLLTGLQMRGAEAEAEDTVFFEVSAASGTAEEYSLYHAIVDPAVAILETEAQGANSNNTTDTDFDDQA